MLALTTYLTISLLSTRLSTYAFSLDDIADGPETVKVRLCGNRLNSLIEFVCRPYGGVNGKRSEPPRDFGGRFAFVSSHVSLSVSVEAF